MKENRFKLSHRKPSGSGKSPAAPSRDFAPILRRVSIASWFLKLLPIPIGLWNAELLSRTVGCAVSGDSGGVLRTGGFLLLLLTFTKTFDFLAGAAYGRASSRALHRCKLLLYRRFLSCPPFLLYTAEHGQATELMNDDFDTVAGKGLNLYPGFFTGLATFSVYFLFLLGQSLQAALSLLGISLLQVIPPLIVKGFLEKNYSENRDIEADITNCTLECYHGFAAVKIFDLKHWCLERLSRLHKDYLKIGNRSEAAFQAQLALDRLVGNILTYGTYGLMGLYLLQGKLTLDTGVEAIALSRGFYGAVKSVFETIPSFAVARAAERRMGKMYGNTAQAEAPAFSPGTEAAFQSGIRFDRVSCSFEGRQILKDFSLSLPPDRTVLIRGANGMGKSTLLRLALGLIHPDSGAVSIGGVPSSALPENTFPERLFYLPQEDPAFHFSPEELYRMVPGVDMEKAISLADRFHLEEEQRKQPLDTLSGGQRKKAFLSLAFALNPGMLLLDEPGNSLDENSRNLLAGLLKERGGGTILVTHDALFHQAADSFYTLDHGSDTRFLRKKR